MANRPLNTTPLSYRSEESPEALLVAIIGGGIGGLTLAIGLNNAGINFHIYEAASQFSEIGAGVGLAPNAQRTMGLIDPRLREAYDKHATLNSSEDHKRYFFEFRMGMTGRPDTHTAGVQAGTLISQPGGVGKGMSMIHRAKFLDELIELLPEGCATFGKRLIDLKQTEKKARLFFADGTQKEADLVIGCDGVRSAVRASLFGGKAAAQFSGKYAYRGLIPIAEAIAVVGEARARNSQAYLGYGGHVLTMAIDGGETMNVVAFHTKADGKWENEAWALPMQCKEINRDFAEWSADVRGILSLLRGADKWALFDAPPLSTLSVGRVCLLGDGKVDDSARAPRP